MKALYTNSDLKIDIITTRENYNALPGIPFDLFARTGELSLLSSLSYKRIINFIFLISTYFKYCVEYLYTVPHISCTSLLILYTALLNYYTDLLKSYTGLLKYYTGSLNCYTGLLNCCKALLKIYIDSLNLNISSLNSYTTMLKLYTSLLRDYFSLMIFYIILIFRILSDFLKFYIKQFFISDMPDYTKIRYIKFINSFLKPYLSFIYTVIIFLLLSTCNMQLAILQKRNVGESTNKLCRILFFNKICL